MHQYSQLYINLCPIIVYPPSRGVTVEIDMQRSACVSLADDTDQPGAFTHVGEIT